MEHKIIKFNKMKKINVCISITLFLSFFSCNQQTKESGEIRGNIPSGSTIVEWNSDSLVLDNGVIKRKIAFFPGGEVSSVSYRLATSGAKDFLSRQSSEFSIVVNDNCFTGLSKKKYSFA